MRRYAAMLLFFAAGSIGAAPALKWQGHPPEGAAKYERAVARGTPLDSVTALLRDDGYLDATVVNDTSAVVVDAGNRPWVRYLIVNSSADDTLEIAAPFSRSAVARAFEGLIDSLNRGGRLYAVARVVEVVRVGDTIDLRASLDPGPLIRRERLLFEGLTRTSDKLIRDQLGAGVETYITPDYLERLEERARRIPFVVFVPPIHMRLQPGLEQADVVVQFEELPQVAAEGGLGYLPENGGTVLWNLDLVFRNLFGQGRRIGVFTERTQTDRRQLKVSYNQTGLLVARDETAVSIATRDYRQQFYEFDLTARYDRPLSEQVAAGLVLGWRDLRPADSAADYTVYSAGFRLAQNSLSDTRNPRSGWQAESTIGFAFRETKGDRPGDFAETRARADLNAFVPIGQGPVLALGGRYRGLETADAEPPPAELTFVGGPGSLRGFRTEQFTALRTAQFTIEPRYRFAVGYGFIFADGAYLNNRRRSSAGTTTDERFEIGYGLGLALVQQRRGIEFSLGWNPDISFGEARVMIRLTADL